MHFIPESPARYENVQQRIDGIARRRCIAPKLGASEEIERYIPYI
jgi:hypothetical protein